MMNIKEYRKLFMLLVFATLVFTPSVNPASASGTSLKVDILKYEPSPAEIGQYVSIWVKVENIGSTPAEDVSIEMIPKYPFSLDPGDNAVQNIGTVYKDDAALYEYHLFVDEYTKPDTREIDIRYRGDKDSMWGTKTFDIRIGSDTSNSKGTIQLQQIKPEPEVLMPGDTGTVTLTLKNSASENSIRLDGKDYDTNARVKSAILSGTDEITVTSDPYYGTGILGPGDTVNFTYNVEVAADAIVGTKHLEFKVTGNSHVYNYNLDVPLTIDSASIKVIPSKSLVLDNGMGTLEFDIANTHDNTLSSVSIRPEADGVEFSPVEYFIGSMDPDELFTIEFDAVAANINSSSKKNLTLTAQYRNGYNEHETLLNDLSLRIVIDTPKSNSAMTGIGILFSILSVVGVVMYRRNKHQK